MIRTLIPALILIAGSAAGTPVWAQSQTQMNATAARDARSADQNLNTQYAATMGRLSPPSRTLLRAAQRSWIAFRDQQCRFEASGSQGGSAQPMVLSGCVARLTTDRTRELRRLAQCEEGDLSCPQ